MLNLSSLKEITLGGPDLSGQPLKGMRPFLKGEIGSMGEIILSAVKKLPGGAASDPRPITSKKMGASTLQPQGIGFCQLE